MHFGYLVSDIDALKIRLLHVRHLWFLKRGPSATTLQFQCRKIQGVQENYVQAELKPKQVETMKSLSGKTFCYKKNVNQCMYFLFTCYQITSQIIGSQVSDPQSGSGIVTKPYQLLKHHYGTLSYERLLPLAKLYSLVCTIVLLLGKIHTRVMCALLSRASHLNYMQCAFRGFNVTIAFMPSNTRCHIKVSNGLQATQRVHERMQ